METATQPGVVDSKPDLIAIEADFRAGVMSVRAIATKHGVSEGAVRKWAKNAKPQPWMRDLKDAVQARAAEILAADETKSEAHVLAGVRTPHERTHVVRTVRTPEEEGGLADVAARSIVLVVREHRTAIQAGQQMVGMLLGQLQDCASHRERLEDMILEDTAAADGQGVAAAGATRRRTAMMRAVSLPQHASTMKDLAIAMKHLVGLERQAFGLADLHDPQPPAAEETTPQPEDTDFTAIREKFARRIGVVTDVESRAAATA